MSKVVMVRFDAQGDLNDRYRGGSPNVYSFYSDLELEKGDKVVVYCATGYQICTVASSKDIATHDADKATAWIIQKIDTGSVERRKELASLEKELEKAISKAEKRIVATQVANDNPAVMAILDRIKELEAL